jgi:hypothetical protein
MREALEELGRFESCFMHVVSSQEGQEAPIADATFWC